MTDEKRLHGMMADPGPAPVYDANGWPVEAGGLPDRAECADRLAEVWQWLPSQGSMTYVVRCPHGEWYERRGMGRALYRANRWHGFADTTAPPGAKDAPNLPARVVTDSACPASSSASPGGTGGLAEVDALLAHLEAATRTLTGYTRTLRELLAPDRAKGGEPR